MEKGMVASSGKFIIKTVLNISIKAVQRNDIRTIFPEITFFSIIFKIYNLKFVLESFYQYCYKAMKDFLFFNKWF